MLPSRSGGSRKSPKHPLTKDAGTIEVRRCPAHNLQSEIADGVLAQLLGEDYVLDTLPGLLIGRAVLALSCAITNCSLGRVSILESP